jgi:SAM-dependent methyltransferase
MESGPESVERTGLLDDVASYYGAKFAVHGATAEGVDWNSVESQELRFAQLVKVCDLDDEPFSITDYGCGYGALVPYLARGGHDFVYRGYDLSPAMLEYARTTHADPPRIEFTGIADELEPTDYTVASGIFNVKLESEDEAWQSLVLETLERMAKLSRRGFAFNVLTSYSDPTRMRPDLYYADPVFLFDHCKTRYSRNVALLHDYGLYEFTVIVRQG